MIQVRDVTLDWAVALSVPEVAEEVACFHKVESFPKHAHRTGTICSGLGKNRSNSRKSQPIRLDFGLYIEATAFHLYS